MAIPADRLRYAALVRAQVSDEHGRNFKLRSLIVVDQSARVKPDQKVVLVCVTTSWRDDPSFVKLPWTTSGHPATGLRVECAAACRWLRLLDSYEIDEVRGYVPESCMEKIIAQIRRLNAAALSDPTRPIVPENIKPKGQTPRG